MQTVADAMGVTKMTVSLALRDHPSVSIRTRVKVAACARKLGYAPNPLVSALMAGLRQGRSVKAPLTIAFVTVYPEAALASGKMKLLLQGAQTRAAQLGYVASVFSLTDLKVSPARLAGILISRGIRGMVIAPFPEPVDAFDLPWANFASATIARSLQKPELHRAYSNQYRDVLLAFERTWAHGYRRIGFVAEYQQSERCEHWWRNGFRLGAERHGCAPRDCPEYLPEKYEARALMKWFRGARPEVILSVDGRVLDILRDEGVRVPGDVGYVILDRQEETARCAGIDQHHDLVAAAAVDIVIEQLYKNESGVPAYPKSVMIEGVWMDGKSVTKRG